jgi:hypothetical protein
VNTSGDPMNKDIAKQSAAGADALASHRLRTLDKVEHAIEIDICLIDTIT